MFFFPVVCVYVFVFANGIQHPKLINQISFSSILLTHKHTHQHQTQFTGKKERYFPFNIFIWFRFIIVCPTPKKMWIFPDGFSSISSYDIADAS